MQNAAGDRGTQLENAAGERPRSAAGATVARVWGEAAVGRHHGALHCNKGTMGQIRVVTAEGGGAAASLERPVNVGEPVAGCSSYRTEDSSAGGLPWEHWIGALRHY